VADRFGWADEPELLDVRDANRSRKALDALGEAVWREAIDWFYDEAMRRPIAGDTYPESRARFYGPTNAPAPAPERGSTAAEVLAEFGARVAPSTFNAQHPGS